MKKTALALSLGLALSTFSLAAVAAPAPGEQAGMRPASTEQLGGGGRA